MWLDFMQNVHANTHTPCGIIKKSGIVDAKGSLLRSGPKTGQRALERENGERIRVTYYQRGGVPQPSREYIRRGRQRVSPEAKVLLRPFGGIRAPRRYSAPARP